MSQNRLNTDRRDSYVIAPETTASESVSTEFDVLKLCQFESPETYTFETQSGLRKSVDRLVVEVTEVDFATRLIEYERP